MKYLVLIAFLMTGSLAFGKAKSCTDYSQFKDVSKNEMQTIVKNKKATIVDVNSESSFEDTHIPGAVHFGTVEKRFAKVLPKDKNSMVVAYCGGKMCTAWKRAAKMACEMGYKNIRHFSEGISGWKAMNKKG